MMSPDDVQREHYNRIASDYAAHYGDAWSQRYRQRFFNEPMLDGLDLQGRTVVEAMCGIGETTGALIERGARVIGLDISEVEVAGFAQRWPGLSTRCASILQTGIETGSVDCVVVVGGLHHVQPQVPEAIAEIHRILRPGGHFCFVEPHACSLPDRLRRIWYRRDRYFAENEEAIDVGSLKRRFANRFEVEVERYQGNLAYLTVLNSLILRIPLSWKRLYAPALLRLEAMIQPAQGQLLSCYAVGRWRKRTGTA